MVRLLIKNKRVACCPARLLPPPWAAQHALAPSPPSPFQTRPALWKSSFRRTAEAAPPAACPTPLSASPRQQQNKENSHRRGVGQVGQNISLRNISWLNLIYYQFVVVGVAKILILIALTKAYTNLMPQLNSKVVLLCLLPVALAGITNFWDMNPVGQDTLRCLQEHGYLQEAFVLAAFDQPAQRWQVALDLAHLAQAAAKTNLMISTTQIQGRLPPQLEAHRIARQFDPHRIDKFWVGISNFAGSFRPSCAYLKTFALYLRLYTRREVGFQSELLFWEDLFGEAAACPELGEYSLYLSFNNFKPFGGWTDYEFFETYRPVPVCNYPGMEVFRR